MRRFNLLSLSLTLILIFSFSLIPDAVENITIRVDPDVEVWGEDVVKGTDLLVPEERVRHPHLTSVGQSQVFDPLWKEIFFLLMFNFNEDNKP